MRAEEQDVLGMWRDYLREERAKARTAALREVLKLIESFDANVYQGYVYSDGAVEECLDQLCMNIRALLEKP